MPSVTYTVTTAQLAELKAALAHHQGVEVGEITNADLKRWGLRQFQGLVRNYRQSLINTANPVSDDPVAS